MTLRESDRQMTQSASSTPLSLSLSEVFSLFVSVSLAFPLSVPLVVSDTIVSPVAVVLLLLLLLLLLLQLLLLLLLLAGGALSPSTLFKSSPKISCVVKMED